MYCRYLKSVVAFTSAAIAIGAITSCAAQAENADVSARRASERTNFSDVEIKEGFLKTAPRAELQFDQKAERIRKFDEPVRVFVENRGVPDRSAEISTIIADIRAHVDHIDLAMTSDRKNANFLVTLVQRRSLGRTIVANYGREKAKQIQQTLRPECLSGLGKDHSFRIRRAEVILPVDAGEFSFLDCAYEELLQGLGIINDDSSVPWTMFNDDVQMGFFDVYDQYLVNILYDPRVRPGMTKDELDELFPEVLPTVRAWVANANSSRDRESPTSSKARFDAPTNRMTPGGDDPRSPE